ncbi:MAG TPA: SCO family protein [Pyrinomonadaceae bacterium]|jgi:protein SCO1/2|nr:SCO family protein [Pyrinomonadaceae bacterium]
MFKALTDKVSTFRRLRAKTYHGAAAQVVLLCLAFTPHTFGQHRHSHDDHAGHPPKPGSTVEQPSSSAKKAGRIEIGKVSLEIPDVWLSNQDGRRVRFYSDLIKDRVVVLNFFFTSCDYVCPMQAASLSKLKTRLGERLGREVFFVSVSTDPSVDTSKRLKQWGAEFGVGSGWSLLTGERAVMSKLIRDFTGEKLGRQMHSPVILIGNDETGVWAEVEGLTDTEELVKIIDGIARSNAQSSEALSQAARPGK